MAAAQPLRTPGPRPGARHVEVGGQAVHVFRFAAAPDLAYEYFCDIAAVFRMLPDALDVQSYGDDRYRLVVGAHDGHGHTMAAVFDLLAIYEPGRSIRVVPDSSGPPIALPGMVFSGVLAAEAAFFPDRGGALVEYAVDIEMRIPIPAVLRLMPQHLLQGLGERAMEYKMTQMISGFTRAIAADFHAWARGE